MSDLKEDKISSTQIFSGKLIDLYLDNVRLPNGKQSTREWLDHPGAVCLVPILNNGDILLIRQFRYGPREEFIEIPEGTKILVDVDLKLNGLMKIPKLLNKSKLSEYYSKLLDDLTILCEN